MALSSDQIKGIDNLRTRLSQLHLSVATLRHELETKDPLPTWATLSDSAHALQFNLKLLTDTLSTHAQFLKEAHAYPLPSFPGHLHEPALNQLLRKKLPPPVESWIYEHTAKQRAEAHGSGTEKGLQDEEFRELWGWAAKTSNSIVISILEEENADRNSEDGDEDEEEDEADEVEGDSMEGIQPSGGLLGKEEDGIDPSQPPMPLESVLRFMTTGALPSSRPPNR